MAITYSDPDLDTDADTVAIAGLSGTGLIARTGTGTASVRTIAGAAGITVTNGDGVSGNPTITLDTDLSDLAALTPTDNGVVIGNGANFVVESGATLKTSLGLTIGVDVQAYDADLATWAGVTPGTGIATALAVNVGTAGAPVLFNGALGTPSSGTLTNATGLPSASIVTTTTNDNAAASKIGEYVESEVLLASAVSLTTITAADVTSISLTAGDWDVWGIVAFDINAATVVNNIQGWVHTVSATQPDRPNGGAMFSLLFPSTAAGPTVQMMPVGTKRLSLSGTTTVYLTAVSNFTTNTNKAYGLIAARRRR